MSEIKIYDQIVYKKIEDIKPYDNNARINNRAIDALEKMIPVAGFNVPIVIDKNNVIIKGHSRYEALKNMGYEAVPCIISDDNENDAAEERLVDNKSSELATWEDDKLNMELREMNINLRDMNIDVPYVKNGVNQIADVSEKQVDNAQEKLIYDRKTTSETRELIEVHCDSCGETFFVNYGEVQKYAE